MSAGSPDGAAVAVHGLVKRYGKRTVVDDVSFDVHRGELFALLGPNGAGKTTSVEIIEGYRTPDAGSVAVFGLDPTAGGRELRARVGLMLQGGGVDPRARPDEILRLYAAFHADPRDPEELIDLVGLRAVARSRYRRLSGGEKQRLGLALALVGRPELLVLDEPTAGMDPAARAATRELVRSLCDEGTTILLTTHDLVDVERLADRVAILDHGRIVAIGAPAELTAGGSARLTVRLETAPTEPDLSALRASVPASVDVTLGHGNAQTVVIAGPPPDPALVASVAAWAASCGILIAELWTTRGTLEDRYLELTGAVESDVATTRDVAATDDAATSGGVA
jgi:ABC-2 type transport system ATP-binding protein